MHGKEFKKCVERINNIVISEKSKASNNLDLINNIRRELKSLEGEN